MKNFRYVWYQKAKVELTDFLHIGGEEKEENSMALDGNGRYILPASGIAGAVKAYLSGISSNAEEYLGKKEGKKTLDSQIYYYDSLCKNVQIESRKGIEINPVTAAAADGKIYTLYTIGQGMQAELKLQAFLEKEEECGEVKGLFEQALAGIEQGHLTFGARKSVGGGRFKVLETGERKLDLKEEEDFQLYLSGTEAVFEKISYGKYENMPEKAADGAVTEFRLNAEIEDGLIVKSGERDAVTENEIRVNAVNMSKTIDGKAGYFIPGTTIKGAVRGYSEKIAKTLGISENLMTELFGGELEQKKFRSHIKTWDAEIADADKTVYNRIKIDRWLGSVIEGANAKQEILSTKKGKTISILVQTDMADEEKQKLLNGLVFLTMRDLGLGRIPIGSGSAVGFGRLTGKSLLIDGKEYLFSEKGLIFSEEDETIRNKIGEWLSEVKKCGEN